jgi:hypothetical protein
MRRLAFLALGFLAGAAVGVFLAGEVISWAPPSNVTRLERRLILTELENERLRGLVAEHERAKSLEKSKAQRAEIERQVEAIRGLKFKTPVDYNVLGRAEIKAVVAGKLAEVYSEQEFTAMSAAFARLGLLPENFPLRQTYIDLLGEQIAAFYDQHQHKLFMFEDATLDNAQNRIVLAHELTHALADQHFALRTLPLEIKNNDDRAVAASALVEGEATLVMSDFMLRNLSLGALKDNLAGALGQSMEQLQKAPRFLRESLIFPYLRGQELCAVLMTQGGYEAVSEAYNNPPSSTAQVLHPEKYLAQPREEPIAVEWPATQMEGRPPSIDNVAGEFAIRILLAETTGDARAAEKAAEGWRGDRYLSYGNGEALVWKTLWASEAEAAEFFAAQRQAWEKRYAPAAPRSEAQSFSADAPRALRLIHARESVLCIDAPVAATAERLREQFGQ